MKNKYFGYYKDNKLGCFYEILWIPKPRWRYVDSYTKVYNDVLKISGTISVDYLRLHCEKISESEFKKYIK